jgi:serine/threonine protein phosphatase PrpC
LGDLILVCSDGLTKALQNRQILKIITVKRSVKAICDNLVREAIGADGSDNVTVSVARAVQR